MGKVLYILLTAAFFSLPGLKADELPDTFREVPRQFTAKSIEPHRGPIILAYWNIQDLLHEPNKEFSQQDIDNHLYAVTIQLNKYNPTILVASEVGSHETALALNQLLRDPYPYVATTDYRYRNRPEREGKSCTKESAVFSRIPWTSIEELDYPLVNKHLEIGTGRGFLKISFMIKGRPLTVYSGHLKSNFGGETASGAAENRLKRETIARQVLKDIKRANLSPSSDNVIVCGDFNTDLYSGAFQGEQTVPMFLEAGFRNMLDKLPPDRRTTVPAIFFRGVQYDDATFDYMLTSKPLSRRPFKIVQECSDSEGENNVGLPGFCSDHYMLMLSISSR